MYFTLAFDFNIQIYKTNTAILTIYNNFVAVQYTERIMSFNERTPVEKQH